MQGKFSRSRQIGIWLGIGACCVYAYYQFSPASFDISDHIKRIRRLTTGISKSNYESKPVPINTMDEAKEDTIEDANFDPSTLETFDQLSPALLPYLRKYFLTPPPVLAFGSKINTGPTDIVQQVWPILQEVVGESGGFFVEAGANDGVAGSNTLWLEEEHGWSGLLVECHPKLVAQLLNLNRKAFISNACLAKTSHPAMVLSVLTAPTDWNPSSTFNDEDKNWVGVKTKSFTKFTVQTVPLYSLLAAINITVVDLFTLDIQSMEYEVLQSFPFGLVQVKIWCIETVLLTPRDLEGLNQLMKANGYVGPIFDRKVWNAFYVLKSLNTDLSKLNPVKVKNLKS